MPGLGALLIVVVIPLFMVVSYRIGYRVGRAEGLLQGRDEAEGRKRSA